MEQKRSGRPNGYRCTEETKKKISDSMIGKCHTEETKRKIGETVKNWYKHNSDSETEINRRAKLSERMKKAHAEYNEYLYSLI